MSDGAAVRNDSESPGGAGTLRRVIVFPVTRLLIAVVVMSLASVLAGLIVNDLLGLDNAAARAVVVILCFHTAYVVYVRAVERRPVVELAPGPAPVELALGSALGFGLVTVVVALLWALGFVEVTAGSSVAAVAGATMIAVQTAYIEELLVRGVVFRIVEEGLGSWIAVILVALLFGALHMGNPNATIVSTLAIAATAGLLLAAAYMITRRLWLAIGLHFAVNWTQGPLFGLPVSGIEQPGLLASRLEGPWLLTGGDWGVEASLPLVVVGVAMGVEMLRRAHRRGCFVAPLWSAGRDVRSGGIFIGDGDGTSSAP